MTRIQLANTLTPGDRITEVDTPEGPFYLVAKINPKSIVIDDGGYPIRLPIRGTDQVRVAIQL